MWTYPPKYGIIKGVLLKKKNTLQLAAAAFLKKYLTNRRTAVGDGKLRSKNLQLAAAAA